MNIFSSNRRKNRSENIHNALEFQLAASAKRAKFSAMVLADADGFVVSAVGDETVWEQIAAISPSLAPNKKAWHGPVDTLGGERRLTVSPMRVRDTELYLAACEGKKPHLISLEMYTSGTGIGRILA